MLSPSNLFRHARYLAMVLREPLNIPQNNLLFNHWLASSRSAREKVWNLERTQYGASLDRIEHLARRGLERIRSGDPFAEGTLGRSYQDWMAGHGFDVEQLHHSVTQMLELGFPILAFYNAYGHDIAHVLSGIDISLEDEFFIQGVLNATPTPTVNNLFYRDRIRFAALRAVEFSGVGRIRESIRTFHAGHRVARQRSVGAIGSPLTVPFLDQPLSAARTRFGVPDGWLVGVREGAEAAPSSPAQATYRRKRRDPTAPSWAA